VQVVLHHSAKLRALRGGAHSHTQGRGASIRHPSQVVMATAPAFFRMERRKQRLEVTGGGLQDNVSPSIVYREVHTVFIQSVRSSQLQSPTG
jgi:hypothetical protein